MHIQSAFLYWGKDLSNAAFFLSFFNTLLEKVYSGNYIL